MRTEAQGTALRAHIPLEKWSFAGAHSQTELIRRSEKQHGTMRRRLKTDVGNAPVVASTQPVGHLSTVNAAPSAESHRKVVVRWSALTDRTHTPKRGGVCWSALTDQTHTPKREAARLNAAPTEDGRWMCTSRGQYTTSGPLVNSERRAECGGLPLTVGKAARHVESRREHKMVPDRGRSHTAR